MISGTLVGGADNQVCVERRCGRIRVTVMIEEEPMPADHAGRPLPRPVEVGDGVEWRALPDACANAADQLIQMVKGETSALSPAWAR